MYRIWAIVCGTITVVLFLAWCSLLLLDENSQFVKDYGYTIGLLTLPFCCGVAPVTGILTIVFALLAWNQPR